MIEYQWTEQYNRVVSFKEKSGHLPSSRSLRETDRELGEWLDSQKILKTYGTLPKEKIDKLRAIGYNFE